MAVFGSEWLTLFSGKMGGCTVAFSPDDFLLVTSTGGTDVCKHVSSTPSLLSEMLTS